jgi:CubicO group peptidase (beta-lactamase class C family)
VGDPLTADGLARFSEIAVEYVDSGQVPGVVALVARGGQVHIETHGSLSIGGPPMRQDSIFRVASLTKPVTAAATMALTAEGLLRLDEPVDRLLPELTGRRVLRRIDGPLDDTVPARRAITVRDLLTFTFGFGASGEMLIRPERFLEQATGVVRRGGRADLDRRRHAGVLTDADTRRQPRAARRCGRGDDPRSAYSGAETPPPLGQARLRRPQLGILHVRDHRRAGRGQLYARGRPRHDLAGESGARPDRYHLDPAAAGRRVAA